MSVFKLKLEIILEHKITHNQLEDFHLFGEILTLRIYI